MPTFKTIMGRLEGIGIPVAHNQFVDTKQNPAPEPPFICWLSSERQYGSDHRNEIREVRTSIELYTDRKEDTELEGKIERDVLHDVEFQKYQALIEDENMMQTAYEFNLIEKTERRKRHG